MWTTSSTSGSLSGVSTGSSSGSGTPSSSGSSANTKLDRAEFLEFLKRQQQINAYEDGLYGFIAQDETAESSGNNMNKLSQQLQVPNNFNQNDGFNQKIVMDKPFRCVDQDRDSCLKEKGCSWNEDSIICSDLSVKFFSSEKIEGENYSLNPGNYDVADIDNLEFYPEYIAVPFGLRVKIWHKEGFVGLFDAYLGNYNPDELQESQLYKIKNLGSIQICSLESCNKPSPYSAMKLVNIMDGKMDRIDKNTVKNMSEYKNKLRKNIVNRVKYVKNTQGECLQEIVNYLRHNGVNLHKNFQEENDIGTFRKLNFF